MNLFIRLLSLCLLWQMAISFPLWAWRSSGSVPALPVWAEAFEPLHWAWAFPGLLPAAPAVALLVFPARPKRQLGLAAALALSVLFDLNRLQPWVYWYILMFGALGFGKKDLLPWVLAAVYGWGGLHKLTPWFAEDNFPWFCEAFGITRPLGIPAMGYAAAVAEALPAVLLLWATTRRVGVYLALGLHAWIILVLSPLGLDWNTVVIPWNVAMAASVWFVFTPKNAILNVLKPLDWALTVWLLLSPALPFLPRALGWHLYNNTQPEATFVCPGEKPVCVANWNELAYDNGTRLLLDDWAARSLGAPLFHSEFTFRQLHRYLCRCAPHAEGMEVLEVDWQQKENAEVKKTICVQSID